MTRLLFIKASPRGGESRSTALAEAYLARLRAAEPALDVDVLDLATATLPDYDGDKVAAKMTVIAGQANTGAQQLRTHIRCRVDQHAGDAGVIFAFHQQGTARARVLGVGRVAIAPVIAQPWHTPR